MKYWTETFIAPDQTEVQVELTYYRNDDGVMRSNHPISVAPRTLCTDWVYGEILSPARAIAKLYPAEFRVWTKDTPDENTETHLIQSIRDQIVAALENHFPAVG